MKFGHQSLPGPQINTNKNSIDNGDFWIATDDGLRLWSQANKEFREIDNLIGTKSLGSIWDIFPFSDTEFLISSKEQGVLIFDKEKKRISSEFVLNDGQVSEIGNEKELLSDKGEYYKLTQASIILDDI